MNRIDPELVVRAYEITGLKPVRNAWGSTVAGTACGLSAVCVAAEKGHPGDDRVPTQSIIERLDLDRDYLVGYQTGFDQAGDNSWFSQDGYNDGTAAARLVFGEAG